MSVIASYIQCSQTSSGKESLVIKEENESVSIQPDTSELEKSLIQAGLVNIQTIEPALLVELKYSTNDNFMKRDMYGGLEHAYLQPDVAEKLKKAYQILHNSKPELTLLIYDCVRPHHIQQMMWDSLKLPISQKTQFLANPANGSIHNYGAAVDLTIANLNGQPLDMGSPYDYIGALARPDMEMKFLSTGELSQEQIDNRKLLRTTMTKAGFIYIKNEWWHFNSCSREQAKVKYKRVD